MVGRRQAGWQGSERTREYPIAMGLPGDEGRVRFVTVRGRVTAFTVQYEALIEGRHYPVARYDTAHGAVHLDLLDWEGRVVDKQWVAWGSDGNQALTRAIRELRANALTHRDEFLRRQR